MAIFAFSDPVLLGVHARVLLHNAKIGKVITQHKVEIVTDAIRTEYLVIGRELCLNHIMKIFEQERSFRFFLRQENQRETDMIIHK